MENISPGFIFSLIGLFAGTSSLIFLIRTLHRGPEALRSAIIQFFIAMSLITLAFLWDIIFSFKALAPVSPLDIHHLLMATSILFFVNAARKFYDFGR